MAGNARFLPARTILRAAAVLLVALALVFLLKQLKESGLLARILAWLSQLGPWAPLAFVVVYTLAVLLFVPGSILTIGAGIVFARSRLTDP